MIERNRHDCRNLGRSDDVGGIEPAAKPHLEHHDIAADVREMHEHGIRVNAWTCDKPEEALELVKWGVDYITSNILE